MALSRRVSCGDSRPVSLSLLLHHLLLLAVVVLVLAPAVSAQQVSLGPVSGQMDEADLVAALQRVDIVLLANPGATVALPARETGGQATVTPTTITFTTANWSLTQTITATAVDDALTETSPHAGTLAVGGSGIEDTGTGADGALVVNGGTDLIVNDYAHVTSATTTAGSTTIIVNSGAAFSNGDEIFVWQTQDATNHGVYEYATIASGGGTTTLTLTAGLANAYNSGSFDQANAQVTQVVRIPQYTTVDIPATSTITAKAWDGYSGGIVIFRASGAVSTTGAINVDGLGFRGGTCGACGNNDWGTQGEGYLGLGIGALTANGNGGGGGYGPTGFGGEPGGGGGHQTAGDMGVTATTNDADGGGTIGQADMLRVYMGGGGGGGGDNDGRTPYPIDIHGAGVVFVSAQSFSGSGALISANGLDALYNSAGGGASGAGAGGAVFIACGGGTCTEDSITVSGGAEVLGSNNNGGVDVGGAGGDGWILNGGTLSSVALSILDNDVGAVLTLAYVSDDFAVTTAARHDGAVNDHVEGEEVTMLMTAEFADTSGTFTETTIRLQLSTLIGARMEVVSCTVSSIGSNLVYPSGLAVSDTATLVDSNSDGWNDQANFYFGDVVNDNSSGGSAAYTAEFDCVTRMTQDEGNVFTPVDFFHQAEAYAGTALTSISNTYPYELVDDHNLIASKSGNSTTGDAGDSIIFEVRVEHQSPGTASYMSAYDLNVRDDGGGGYFILKPETLVVLDAGCGVATIIKGDQPGDTEFEINFSELCLSDVIKIEYETYMDNTVPLSDKVRNLVNVTGYTTPNQLATSFWQTAFTVVTGSPDISFDLGYSSLPDTDVSQYIGTDYDVSIGEILTFVVIATFPEGVSPLVLDVQLSKDGGLVDVTSCEIVRIGGQLSGPSVVLGSIGNITDSNADSYNDLVTVDFGQISNAFDNVESANDELELWVNATVVDVPTNQNGVPLNHFAQITFGVGDLVCFLTTYDGGNQERIMTPIDKSFQTAIEFYAYGSPAASSSNTGFERADTILMYFIKDNTNQTAFVLVHDKAGEGTGGNVVTYLDSDNLAGTGVSILFNDDPGEGEAWDTVSATGSMTHAWQVCCTDGFILGYMPLTNFCLRPSFQISNGISDIALMVEEDGIIQYTFFSPAELAGLSICGLLCNSQTFLLATKSTTTKTEIVLPEASIVKTTSTTDGDAGDLATFQIVVSSNANCPDSCSPAYGVVIEDTFGSDYNLEPTSVSTTGAMAHTIASGTTGGDTVLRVEIPTFVPGSTITVDYQAYLDISVRANDNAVNTANLSYCSHDNDEGRCYTAQDSAQVLVDPPVVVDFTVVSTELADTDVSQFVGTDVDLAIGEEVVLEFVISLPESTNDVVVTWTMPSASPGTLTILNATISAIGSNIVTTASVGDSGTITAPTVVFNLGSVANTPDNVESGADQLAFRVALQYDDVGVNTAGTSSDVTVDFDYVFGNLGATFTSEVVEPDLTIAKTATINVPFSSPIDAGDVIDYEITVDHSGSSSSTAFNIVIGDALPTGIALVASSLSSTHGTATESAGTTIQVDGVDLALGGGPIVVTYQGVILDTAGVSTLPTIVNTANLAYTSHPDAGKARAYTGSDTASVTIDNVPIVTVNEVATSFSATTAALYNAGLSDLAVGETVTYDVTVSLAEGTSDLTVEYVSPAGGAAGLMEPVSMEIVSIGGQITTSATVGQLGVLSDASGAANDDTATLTFGSLVNAADNVVDTDDEIVIRIIAVVVDDLTVNVEPLQLDGVIRVDHSTAVVSSTQSADLLSPHPVLNVAKTAAPTSGVDAGDTVTFTVVVDHDATSTGNALAVAVVDNIPAVYSLVAGTLSATPAVSVTSGSGAGEDIDVSLAQLDYGATLTLSYDVVLLETVGVDAASHDNTASLSYDEDSSASPTVLTDSDTATVSVDRVPTANAVSITATSYATTQFSEYNGAVDDVALSEQITYEYEITLPEGTSDVTITVDFPTSTGDIFVVSSEVLALGSGGTMTGSSLNVGDPGTEAAASVTFTFGRVVNTGDNAVDAGDVIRVQVVGEVSTDAAKNTPGTTATTTVTLDYSLSTIVDTIDVELVLLDRQFSLEPAGATEAEVHGGTVVLDLILVDEVWSPDVGTDAGVTAQLVNAFSGSDAFAYAFENGLKAQIGVGNVTRVNATLVQIALPAWTYTIISGTDTLSVTTLPAATLQTGVALGSLTETFAITNVAGVAVLRGSLDCDEVGGSAFTLVDGGDTLDFVIQYDTWDSVEWAAATNLDAYDALGFIAAAEVAVLDVHMTAGDRPDYLTSASLALVDDFTARLTYVQAPPFFAAQLAAAVTRTLDARFTTSGTAMDIDTTCAFEVP